MSFQFHSRRQTYRKALKSARAIMDVEEVTQSQRWRRGRRCAARWLVAGVFAIHCIHFSFSLSSLKSTTGIRRGGQLPSTALHSPLFQRSRHPSSTARHMVLTTPESIIEQASTQNLLDDLIDESVRTSARKPIMMQFDPSSGWVSALMGYHS